MKLQNFPLLAIAASVIALPLPFPIPVEHAFSDYQ